MGPALAQAHSWFAKRAEDLAGVDRQFIELSMRRDELERQQRERLRRRLFGVAIAALVVVSVLAAVRLPGEWREGGGQTAGGERAQQKNSAIAPNMRLRASCSGS